MFQEKPYKLAWTLFNTMNNVHHCHTLHNNMSLDNVILHFLPIFLDKVYIGICNWIMAGSFNELKESLYIYKIVEAQSKTIQNRWWVALELNYVL
jgi:hypothetical protein